MLEWNAMSSFNNPICKQILETFLLTVLTYCMCEISDLLIVSYEKCIQNCDVFVELHIKYFSLSMQ